VGRVLGAPVILKPSWFLIAAAVTVAFAPSVSDRVPGIGGGAFGVSFCVAVMLLLSVLVHELAHAVAAYAVGTPADAVVLDLWGGHTSFTEETASPWRSTVVAVVGPLANGLIAGLAGLVSADGGVARVLVLATVSTNIFVAVFNALPGLPLDGGRVFEALVWRVSGDRTKGSIAAGWSGRAVAVGLAGWALGVVPLPRPGAVAAVWLVLVAVLLWQGATQAVRVARWRRRAPGVSARGLLRPAVPVASNATLAAATEAATRAGASEVVVLDVYGRPAAIVDSGEAAGVPAERVGQVQAGAVAHVVPAGAVVRLDLAGERLIETLEGAPASRYVVVDEAGTVVGTLAWDDVAAAVR